MTNNITRRNLVAGSVAMAGIAAAVVNGLDARQALAQDVATADGTPDWLGVAPEIAEGDVTETVDTEVLVIGCGSGGLIAALSAAENGAQTLCIETLAQQTEPREDIGAIDSKLQLAAFDEFPQFKIEKKDAVEDIVRYANGYCNYDLIKLWADNSGETVDWIADIISENGNFRMNFEGSVGTTDTGARDRAFATGHSPEKLVDDDAVTFGGTLQAKAEEYGAQFRFSTTFIECEQDEGGKVTGVIAQDNADGHYVRINASKGVVLATGGYLTNTEMMRALQPEVLDSRITLPMGSTGDGSGIKAGMWLGARKDPIGTSIVFNRACCLPTETAGYETVGQWFWFGEQPFLKVNLNGERFCNESGPYDYMIHSAWAQPFHTYCDIWDSNAKEQVEQFNEVGCCRLFPFDNGAPMNAPFDAVWEGQQSLIDDGYIIKADTLEELAEGLNIPVETFVATVGEYNDSAAAGEDPKYYKEQYRLMPLDTPPYYGVRVGAWHLSTFDGLLINTHMQVLDQDNSPIEGLYAIGDCSGGFFCVSYPNLFTGLACGRTMTEARIVGAELAAK